MKRRDRASTQAPGAAPRPMVTLTLARQQELAPLAEAVRGALKKAAREQRTTTWWQLRKTLGERLLPKLKEAEKVCVLAQVDAATPADEPPLSLLLAKDDRHVHRTVLSQLERPVPSLADADAETQRQLEELHRLWRDR